MYKPALSISHEAMLVDGKDDFFLHVLFLSRMFSDRLVIFRELIGKKLGLTGNQYAIFLAIAHSQKNRGVSIREVAKFALMAPSHVTTQSGALIQKGLIKKVKNNEDARSVLLLLTPAGEKAMKDIAVLRQKINDIFFAGVSKKSLIGASAFLEQVRENSETAMHLIDIL